jgi:hypothetical protein
MNGIGVCCLIKKHFGRTKLPLIQQPNSTHILASWKNNSTPPLLQQPNSTHSLFLEKANNTLPLYLRIQPQPFHFSSKKYSFKCSNNNIFSITLYVCPSSLKTKTIQNGKVSSIFIVMFLSSITVSIFSFNSTKRVLAKMGHIEIEENQVL